jgi:uncharacterized protein
MSYNLRWQFRFSLMFLAVLGAACCVRAEKIREIRPIGYVSDLAGVLVPDTKTRLETLCTEVEQKAGAQMAIVTVKSLDGESVENYAVDLFKQLGVGGKQSNRGVLLLVAPRERKYRIEVGYGLEPVINDARAGDVGRAMVPFLRQSDYSGAIETAAWQLARYIVDDRGVTLSGQPQARAVKSPSNKSSPIGLLVVFGIVILFILLANRSSSRGRRGGRSGSAWWIGPILGGGGGFGGGSGGYSGGGGFGGFGGGSSGGGGASGSW